RVARDAGFARRAGLTATPAFFVNGRRHEGAYDAGSLVEALRGGN
ncbi:MAG: Thioredoxin, partial [Thermoplasmata archaeon]|nr:Thioredoxin [Thermoplasmata archaeon]